MWTINDFPAYGMLSGWQTAGKLTCRCCMENTKAFQLRAGKKIHGLIVIVNSCQWVIITGEIDKLFVRIDLNSHLLLRGWEGSKFGNECHHYRKLLMTLKTQKCRGTEIGIIGQNEVFFGNCHISAAICSDTILTSCTLKKMCLIMFFTL